MPFPDTEPPRDCPRCPRLAELREDLRRAHPDWWNAPVPAWGDPHAWLAIVGLAPGLRGANRTGRPFTGDYSGILFYETLLGLGLAEGRYSSRADDGLRLIGCIVVNAVRCLPPKNRPLPEEVAACREYYAATLSALPGVRVLVALGRIAHDNAIRAASRQLSQHHFAHGAEHRLDAGRTLIDSYHCSRQNTNTGRLTRAMFEDVFRRALELQP